MILFKISRLCLILIACTVSSYVTATEDGEVAVVTPGTPFRNGFSSHPLPEALSPAEPTRNSKILRLEGPLLAHELGQLKGENHTIIYLNTVYICKYSEEERDYVPDGYLTISPEVFNPAVEELSLRVCGLGDEKIKEIGQFKHLKTLDLSCNRFTDAGIHSILLIPNLTSLSLALNSISNEGLKLLLTKKPPLEELDIAHNKGVNDESADALRESNLKKLKVAFTGMSKEIQREFEKKYRAH